MTPLSWHAYGGNYEIVQLLLENGADINAQDKYGMTPMHHTAIRGNRKALQRLLITPGMGS